MKLVQIKFARTRGFLRSFLIGAGSVIAICPTTKPSLPTRHKSDTDALRSDWVKIGQDFRVAIQDCDQTASHGPARAH
jgi:hypothetical protein